MPYLPLRFAEQVTRLVARLKGNLPGLVRGALDDVAPGLTGGITDVHSFIFCDIVGRPLRRRTPADGASSPRVLSHCFAFPVSWLYVRSPPPTLAVPDITAVDRIPAAGVGRRVTAAQRSGALSCTNTAGTRLRLWVSY
jgi:hypothetical protein